jgi:hypothetical protein
MLRISKQTRLKPEQVLEQAANYFGKNGLGLDEKEQNPCCIYFEGAGGYISINILEGDKQRGVEVESREWDYQAKRFLEKI